MLAIIIKGIQNCDIFANTAIVFYTLQAHGLANFSVAREPAEERQELVYEIETSWYGGNHPLTFFQHQELINKHEELLKKYREKTKVNFDKLQIEGESLDQHDIFSEENMKKALTFSEHVFGASRKCSQEFAELSGIIIEDSVKTLESCSIVAPCKFAVMALGSVAKGEATPYSDLEYAFIIEQHDEYFEKLAMQSYFQIGNFGETPLKCFDISELKGSSKCSPNVVNTVSGYKIDGITDKAGNMPTGNGKENGEPLTFTVDELMELYKREAESPLGEIAGDKSDMLSSTVVIYTNEGVTSQLHQDFENRRIKYEVENAIDNKAVVRKRLDSFSMDMNSYKFLPDFIQFQPPKNLNIELKTDIFRYPTLLANNIKMLMGWHHVFSWDTYSHLRRENILPDKFYRQMKIILALSIFLRTSTYLKLNTQTKYVSVDLNEKKHSTPSYKLPDNLFITLGCLLTPIKRALQSTARCETGISSPEGLVRSMFNNIQVYKSDLLLKADVYYFCGQYHNALNELSKIIGISIASTSCDALLTHIAHKDISARKCIELCCYLLYYTENYKTAISYINWLDKQPSDNNLWKLLAAHCQEELGDYKTARLLLIEVS